jgi:hypothetical protein
MKLLGKFSPRLRRIISATKGDNFVRGLLQVSPSANTARLRVRLESIGAEIQSWPDHSRLITIRIPSSKLAELQNVDEIVYVEGGDRYSLA